MADYEEFLDKPFIFTLRPAPVPGDMRPIWRISVLILILKEAGRGNSASLQTLHVLNWAVRNRDSRKTFIRFIDGQRTPEDVIFRCEPVLNRAIHYAEAEGLVKSESQKSGSFKITLTERGIRFAEQVAAIDGCLVEEKAFLKRIKGNVSQKAINKLLIGG